MAWDKKGAPKKNFKLDVENILRAEQLLTKKLA